MQPETYLAISLVVLAGWIAWLYFQRSRQTVLLEREKMATIGRLVDKFPAHEELLAFLQSNEGRGLFAAQGRKTSVLRTVMRFMQMGSVTAFLGLALLWNAHALHGNTDAHSLQQMDERSYWGTALLGLSGGLLAAGAASYLLVRKARMLDESDKSR
jgi:hypothetical protein